MANVVPLRWPADDDDPVRDGDLTGRQWRAEHAIAHAETGICFTCWFAGHAACGTDPLCENTEKETPVPTQTAPVDEWLAYCQHETDPFMRLELDAIDHYQGHIDGFPDAFDMFDAGDIREHGNTKLAELMSHLHDWRDHIDNLYADLFRLGDGDRLTVAAARYVDLETARWRHAAAVLTNAALTYLGVGFLPDPTGDAWTRRH